MEPPCHGKYGGVERIPDEQLQKMAEAIQDNVITGQYDLLETMAERLTSMILADYPMVRGVKISIKKPKAIPDAQCARVAITRYQPTESI